MTLQEGTYQATVIGHQLITSPKKGTPGLDVKVRFNDGFQDVTMTGTIWLSAKAPEKSREQLEAIGFRPKENRLADLSVGGVLSLVGNECQIEIGEEEWNGKKTTKIKWFGAGAAKPPDPEELARLDDLMAACDQTPAAAPPTAFTGAVPTPPAPLTDENGCPF